MANNPIEIFPLGFPWNTPDPFLFCAYHYDQYPEGNHTLGPATGVSGRALGSDFDPNNAWRMYHGKSVPGFPAHPHCGFETITIVTEGLCDHSDSLGAAARFGQGDVQWITTGDGLQHSEMFPLVNQDKPNPLELFQIWLNLPAKSKRVSPYFKMYWKEEVPVIRKGNSSVTLVAGSLDEIQALSPPPDSWAAAPENEVVVAIVDLAVGEALDLPPLGEMANRNLYFFEGESLTLTSNSAGGSQTLMKGQGVSLNNDYRTLVGGDSPSRLLWLQGCPINEPVAKYGPFVMNTPEEIQQAMNRFRRTQFGGWPWDRHDPVHRSDQGRFAQFPDGELVQK